MSESPTRLDPDSSANHTPSPAISTIPLPIEVQFYILRYLATQDLATCLRVSKDYHHAVIPLLYRELMIDLAKDTNPLLILRGPNLNGQIRSKKKKLKRPIKGWKKMGYEERLVKVWEERIREDKRGQAIKRRSEIEILKSRKFSWLSWDGKSIPSIGIHKPLLLSVDFITHLTLNDHPRDTCNPFQPLIIPHLASLRLIPHDLYTGHYLPCQIFEDHKAGRPSFPLFHCSLLTNLSFRRLVLGSVDIGVSVNFRMFWDPLSDNPGIPPDGLEELVIHLGSIYGPSSLSDPEERASGDETIIKYEKVTLILQPGRALSVYDEDPRRPSETYWQISYIVDGFVWVLLAKPYVLEVVGLEEISRRLAFGPSFDLVEVIRIQMRESLKKLRWAEEKVRKSVGDIVFVRMDD